MSKIFWTTEEHELVLNEAVNISHHGKYGLLEAIGAAQKLVLPPNRHRPLNSASSVVKLTKELRRRLNMVTPPVAKVDPQPVEINASEPHPEVTIDPLDDAIKAIANCLAERIAAQVKAQLQEVKELEHYFKVQKHHPEYAGGRLFKPRVTIIGLLGDQVHNITREFENDFAIRCIDTDRAMGMSPPDADAYLLMKNFINHPLYHKYRSFPNHVLIDGGMSSLRMWFQTRGKEL